MAYYSIFPQKDTTIYSNPDRDLLNTGNDESACSTIVLYNPSSTTFVKHFIARTTGYGQSAYNMQYFTAGYFNTTSAVNGVKFKMATGNMDSGVIKLYGIS